MILPCLPCTLPIENFKFCSPFFFNCLNLRVLYRHWTLAVQEVSPNWSHTESKESIVFQFQTVSKTFLPHQRTLLCFLVSLSMEEMDDGKEADCFCVFFYIRTSSVLSPLAHIFVFMEQLGILSAPKTWGLLCLLLFS